MRYKYLIPALFAVSACVSAPAGADGGGGSWANVDTDWRLVEMDGAPFPAKATLRIGAAAVLGKGPCNSYRGSRKGDYPALEIAQIAATRMTCPDLALESAYLTRLGGMTEGRIDGDRLILSDGKGGSLVFQAAPG
jgi:heat shock protein HslJ